MLLNSKESIKRAHEAHDEYGSWDAVRKAVAASQRGDGSSKNSSSATASQD